MVNAGTHKLTEPQELLALKNRDARLIAQQSHQISRPQRYIVLVHCCHAFASGLPTNLNSVNIGGNLHQNCIPTNNFSEP